MGRTGSTVDDREMTSRPQPPLGPGRIAAAAGATFAVAFGALVVFVVALDDLLCDFESGTCEPGEVARGRWFLLLAAVVFVATSPVAGLIARRWWAWLTPVWLVCGLVTLMEVVGAF